MLHLVRPFVDHPGAEPPNAGTLPTLATALTALGTYRARLTDTGLSREFVEADRLRSEGVDPRAYAAAVEPADGAHLATLEADVRRGGRGEAQYRVRCRGGRLHVRERAAADRDGTVIGVIEDAGGERERLLRAETIERLLIELEEHLYTGWFDEAGTYHETYQSPNGELLLGGLEADEHAANWLAAVHPEDRPAYEAFMAAQVVDEAASVEYRLVGGDGVVRWLRERSKSRPLPGGATEVIGIATDISATQAATAALAASEAKLRHVLTAVNAYVYLLERGDDGVWRTSGASPNRRRFTGRDHVDPLTSRSEWLDLIHPDDRDDVLRHTAAFAAGTHFEASYRLVGHDGVERWVLDRNVPYDVGDERSVRLGLVLDVSDRLQLERRLQSSVDQLRGANAELRELRLHAERQARTDLVTGAHNRLALSEHVALALASGQDGGLVLFDLDHFKQINDRFGHRTGDRVLAEVAARLRAAARPGDCVARWGGEEFAVLLGGISGERELRRRAVALQRAVAGTPIALDGEHVLVELSGGATPLRAGDSLDALVELADRALYAAKRRGRNRVLLASEVGEGDRVAELPEALRIAEALAAAVGVREGAPPEHPRLRGLPGSAHRARAGARLAHRAALRARRLAARHRQALGSRARAAQARAARRRGVGGDARASGARRADRRPHPGAAAQPARRSGTTTSTSTGAATPTASQAPRSRSRPASSPSPTRSPR